VRSLKCRNEWGRTCEYVSVCFAKPEDRRRVEAENYKVEAIQDQLDPPSPYGASRYSVIHWCSMQHHFAYERNLASVFRKKAALDLGSAFHLLMASYYRGSSRDIEVQRWRQLPGEIRREALKLVTAYAAEHGDGTFRRLVSEADEAEIPEPDCPFVIDESESEG